jgi:hypothetical protein
VRKTFCNENILQSSCVPPCHQNIRWILIFFFYFPLWPVAQFGWVLLWMTVCQTFARLQIVFICCLYFHLQQGSRLKRKGTWKEDKKYLILPYWSSANKQITIQAKKYKIFEKIKTGGPTLDHDYIMSSFLSWGYRRLSCLGVVDVFPVFGFSTLQGTYIHTVRCV